MKALLLVTAAGTLCLAAAGSPALAAPAVIDAGAAFQPRPAPVLLAQSDDDDDDRDDDRDDRRDDDRDDRGIFRPSDDRDDDDD